MGPKSASLAPRVFWFSFLSGQSTLKHEGKVPNIIAEHPLERVSKHGWENNKSHSLSSGTVPGTSLWYRASPLPAAPGGRSLSSRFCEEEAVALTRPWKLIPRYTTSVHFKQWNVKQIFSKLPKYSTYSLFKKKNRDIGNHIFNKSAETV